MDHNTHDQSHSVGIELRPDQTFGAVRDGERTSALTGDGAGAESGLPTKLSVTPSGVTVGHEAADAGDVVSPFPWYDAERATADAPLEFRQGDLPGREVALTTFLSGARDYWFDEAEEVGVPTAITVPGGFSREDTQRVEQAAGAAGFTDPSTVQTPIATAVWAAERLETEAVLGIVEVGAHWTDIALVRATPEPLAVDVLAQTSEPALGRNALDTAVAEWALERTGEEHGVPINCTEDGFEAVRTAAHEALDEISATGTATVSVAGHSEITAGHGDGTPIAVDVTIDRSAVISAAREEIDRLQSRIQTVRSSVDTPVDFLLCLGDGTEPEPIQSVVEGAFELASTTLPADDENSIAAAGAALIAERTEPNDQPLITADTVRDDYTIDVVGEDGVTTLPVTSSATRVGEPTTVAVTTALDRQVQGRARLVRRHPVTGKQIDQTEIVVDGIPGRSATDVEVELAFAFDREGDVEVDARLATDDYDEHLAVTLDATPEGPIPWLAATSVVPDADTATAERAVTLFDREALDHDPAFDDISAQAVVERVYQTRRDLWRLSNEDDDLDPEKISALVRKFDSGLRRFSVQPIEPDPGTEMTPSRHRAVATEPSTETEGTILSVRQPGLEVDGTVVDSAWVVIAAEGEPTQSDEDTASAAEKGAVQEQGQSAEADSGNAVRTADDDAVSESTETKAATETGDDAAVEAEADSQVSNGSSTSSDEPSQ